MNFMYSLELLSLMSDMSARTCLWVILSLFGMVLTGRCQHLAAESKFSQLSFSQQLGFQNVTGRGVTTQQLSTFIKLANYASMVYGDDVQKCTKYIKMRMDSLFGIQNYYFMLFIQTTTTVGNRYIWVNHDSVFAGLAGINQRYPQWSYFFSRNYGSSEPQKNIYFSPGERGEGITQHIYSLIVTLIDATPADDQCLCPRQSLESISNGLEEVEYGGWSIICAAKPVTHGIIWNYRNFWIATLIRNCHYTIYNN